MFLFLVSSSSLPSPPSCQILSISYHRHSPWHALFHLKTARFPIPCILFSLGMHFLTMDDHFSMPRRRRQGIYGFESCLVAGYMCFADSVTGTSSILLLLEDSLLTATVTREVLLHISFVQTSRTSSSKVSAVSVPAVLRKYRPLLISDLDLLFVQQTFSGKYLRTYPLSLSTLPLRKYLLFLILSPDGYFAGRTSVNKIPSRKNPLLLSHV